MIRDLRYFSFHFSFVHLLVILSSFPNPGSAATSLSDKIYYNLQNDGFAMCFRRFNATHQIGCSSERGGNVGVVHLVRNNSDLEWLENDGAHAPYMAIIDVHMFQRDVFDRLVRSQKVNGLVVVYSNETDKPVNFSSDSTCPNDRSGLYSSESNYGSCRNVTWNPFGNGMFFEDVPFPMVTISNDSDASFIIRDCYEKFNQLDVANMPKGYSLCAMEIKDVMDGAKDTPTCHRRTNLNNNLNPQGYCDPLSNLNIYSYMDALNKSTQLDNSSVIVIGARLDAFSLFDHRYPGYDSAVLGFVTVHAIAEALGKVRHELLDAVYNRPIMFALFHGEAFDYIGSSRMVYDIEQSKFLPVTLESIGTFIEIGQVGLHGETDSLWVHSDPLSSERSGDIRNRVNNLTEQVVSTGESIGLNIRRATEGNPLPPASLQQFLKSPKTSIAGILLSNHNEGFTNSYYNSMHDTTSDTLNASDPDAYSHVTPDVIRLQKIATTIARTVYSILLGNTSDVETVEADNVTIANLIYCFTKNSDCELFNATSEHKKTSILLSHNAFLSRYVGVATSESLQVSKQHQFLLAHFLGSVVENVTSEECLKLAEKNDGYKYVFLNGDHAFMDNTTRVPACMKSTADYSDALSPAFKITDYDWSSNQFPAWTESRWESAAMQMRVFLKPNPDQEIVTLCIGIGVLILSSGLVCLVQRKSELLFMSADA